MLWALSGDILVRLLNTLSPDPEPHSAQAEVLPVGVIHRWSRCKGPEAENGWVQRGWAGQMQSLKWTPRGLNSILGVADVVRGL